MNIPSFAGCVNLISDVVSSLPIKLYKNDGHKIEEVNDYRVSLLNKETGDTLDATQFKKAILLDYILDKGGFAYVNWIGKKIKSIHYIDCQHISFSENYDPIFKEYYVLIKGKAYYPHQFIRLLRNTKDGIKSIPIYEENNKILNVAYNSLKFEENLVASGGNKKGFIKSSKKLTTEAINALKNAWRKLYSNNTENVVILNEGLDFKESSNTSVEMQLNENKKSNGDELCKILNIPPPLLSGEASDNDDKNFIKYPLNRVITVLQTALNRAMLLEDEKDNYFFEVDISNLTKGDIEKRYQAYSTALKDGWMVVDEVRNKENMASLGIDFVKLGLQDGLYDPKSKVVYVLNTNKAVNLNELKAEKQQEGGIDE